jgi:hypothetical protein
VGHQGQAAGLPVFRILGGTRTEVFTYATGSYNLEGEPHDAAAKKLADFVSYGYKAVKLKCGALSLKDEVARIRMVREAIGPDVLFMLDMNAPYDVHRSIVFANAVVPHDIFWLEEPLQRSSPPISANSPTRLPFRSRMVNENGTASPSAISSLPARFVTFSPIQPGTPASPNPSGLRITRNKKACRSPRTR